MKHIFKKRKNVVAKKYIFTFLSIVFYNGLLRAATFTCNEINSIIALGKCEIIIIPHFKETYEVTAFDNAKEVLSLGDNKNPYNKIVTLGKILANTRNFPEEKTTSSLYGRISISQSEMNNSKIVFLTNRPESETIQFWIKVPIFKHKLSKIALSPDSSLSLYSIATDQLIITTSEMSVVRLHCVNVRSTIPDWFCEGKIKKNCFNYNSFFIEKESKAPKKNDQFTSNYFSIKRADSNPFFINYFFCSFEPVSAKSSRISSHYEGIVSENNMLKFVRQGN